MRLFVLSMLLKKFQFIYEIYNKIKKNYILLANLIVIFTVERIKCILPFDLIIRNVSEPYLLK